jgi:probable rRNA maturation factor
MKLVVFKEGRRPVARTRLQKLCDLVAAGEGYSRSSAAVHLVLAAEVEMRRLNREYLGHDRPTDVLSFNIDRPSEAGGVFGEIYISPDVAARQAACQGVPVAEEIARLFCHGLLHLFGYDHAAKVEGQVMKNREDHYLERLHHG